MLVLAFQKAKKEIYCLALDTRQVNDDIQTYFVGQPHPFVNVMYRS